MSGWISDYTGLLWRRILYGCAAVMTIVAVGCVGRAAQAPDRTPEECAIRFVEVMLSGDAVAYTALLSDDYYERAAEEGETVKNQFVDYVAAYVDEALKNMIAAYQAEYGEGWCYSIDVVDSHTWTPAGDSGLMTENYMQVLLMVHHKGKKSEGGKTAREYMSLVLVEQEAGWRIYDMGYTD